MLQPVEASRANIIHASSLLSGGGIVSFPTETVYGLGADAFNAQAVAKIFEAKQRPSFDPLIVHVDGADMLSRVASRVPDIAWRLIEMFWPGPLTLVLDKTDDVPGIVTSGLATVGVREPSHAVARELICEFGGPIAAPSANSFGRLSPTSPLHVRNDLGERVDMILDGGNCEMGVESTIVDVSTQPCRVLRLGALPVEEIERVVGSAVEVVAHSSSNPRSPGQLAAHYAPQVRLVVVDISVTAQRNALHNLGANDLSEKRCGYLAYRDSPFGDYKRVEVLSNSGDLREASARLFECLHRLDDADLDLIVAELVPDQGLGRAVNDRLMRASATYVDEQ